MEKLNKNQDNVKLLQQNQKISNAKKHPIEPDITVRPSISYFIPQNPKSHLNENHRKTRLNSTLLKLTNKKYKQRNSTPFYNPANTSPKSNLKDAPISTKEPIDAVIDNCS